MTLDTPLTDLESVGPKRAGFLSRTGLSTVRDLLFHFPKRYEDRRQFDRFPAGESDEPVCVCGTVKKVSVKRMRGWQKIVEVTLEEDDAHALSSPLICRWFNAHWVQKAFATGERVVVFGKPKQRGKQLCLDHPEFEIVEEDGPQSLHLQRITPVHRATEGVPQRLLRTLIASVLAALPELPNQLPPEIDDLPFDTAVRWIHFPDDWDQLERARRHLVLNEFFVMQLLVASKRAETGMQPGESHCGKGDLMRLFHDALPFPLTGAQTRAISEIQSGLAAEHPMNRLLHGDVGSGKTFVAISAMLLAVEAGYQAALMAPTQILAEQHYLTFKKWLAPLGIRLSLITGSRREETALPLFDGGESTGTGRGQWESADPVSSSLPEIVIGTHALLYDGVQFPRLGLAVIDEQHKFGVMQRAQLIGQNLAPDVLVMTATPIPRTLTMTVYGDLDVSVLNEAPANRGRIITGVRDDSKIPEAVKFLREHLEKGRQAYVVYPLIEESEKLQAKAAAGEFERWKERLEPFQCELLHGRMEPAEKDAVMTRFRAGETAVLIATTVIEVGIDVPNANIMLIENAERFGLAQLHQLRGRIGRGSQKSYCILLTTAANPSAMEKLKILEASRDGFAIAEADLKLRGPGDILGTAQSGLPPLRLGNLLTDVALMQEARNAVTAIFEKDPELSHPKNAGYREVIKATRRLILSQVS